MKIYSPLILSFLLLASCTTADPVSPQDVTPEEQDDTPGGQEEKEDGVFRFRVSIPQSQNFGEDGYDASALESAAAPESLKVDFGPVASFLYIKIEGDGEKIGNISRIKLMLTSENPDLLPFGQADATLKGSEGVVSLEDLSTVSGKGGDDAVLSGSYRPGIFAFVIYPGDYLGVSYTLEFTDGTSLNFEYPDWSAGCETGGSAFLPDVDLASDPEPGPGTSSPIPGWFELPRCIDNNSDGIDDGNSDYHYSFIRRADAQEVRNFSACYSEGKVHPVWVAAPMHNCYLGNSGRNESYQPDTLISCTQAGRWSGYTRGHMVASSERTISRATNRQVFYYSNIGAQLLTGFNTGNGAWNNLEAFVSDQWCADTLYQVIGCIFDSWTDRYGRTVEPSFQDGSQIPTAYYKALLRTKEGNCGNRVDECQASELKCGAFILGHRSNVGHDVSADDLYTIEELEEFTGLSFFVNVPNAPKSVVNASDWGL